MNRIPRSWQGLGLLLGVILSLPLLSGQGCPTTPEEALDSNQTNTGNDSSLDQPSEPADPVAQTMVQVIYPNGGERISVGSIVDVRVFARHEAIPDPILRIFHDNDKDPTNGNTTIGTIKASAGGLGWNTNSLGTGSYYVGVEMVGQDPAVIDYSDAPFSLVPGGTEGPDDPPDDGTTQPILLTVSAPRNQITIFNNHTFTIRWSTNLLPGQGTASVYREPDFDEDGLPDGHALRDLIGSPGIDAAKQTLDFDMTGVVGNFFIVVTVQANDGQVASAYSTGTLKIQAPVFWLGDLGSKIDSRGQKIRQTGSFQGAILRGANFQDNLGSAMTSAGDYDADGINEILLCAQFGKPFLFASGGRGAGEAYLVYGNRTRLYGDYDVNTVGQDNFEGTIFSGIVPNPHGNLDVGGNKFAFTVDGQPTEPFSSEGLRSVTLIPDQDNDGIEELVFGFPWCDSYSLNHQIADGLAPAPNLNADNLIENDGHFLRGGVVVVSSQNPLMKSRTDISRHGDRVIQLHEVGQVFDWYARPMNVEDICPLRDFFYTGGLTYGASDTVDFPCDGFWQRTDHDVPTISQGGLTVSPRIDPPRLADPVPANELSIPANNSCSITGLHFVNVNQIDPPAPPTSMHYFYGRWGGDKTDAGYCNGSFMFRELDMMKILGTGYYRAFLPDIPVTCRDQYFSDPEPPYGCRILGQTTTQLNTVPPTTANRFAASLSTSGAFLTIGAPMRTALQRDVRFLPTTDRLESGEVYLYGLKRNNTAAVEFPWRIPTTQPTDLDVVSPGIPQPHNFIMDDLGFTRWQDKDHGLAADWDCGSGYVNATYYGGGVMWEMLNPIRVVGAAPTDHIGESVQGVYDINNDGVDDLLVGGPGTNSGRGSVYVLYRRQSELEHDYLLERLQMDPANVDRLNGLYIVGEQGENLGTSLGGLGPASLNDDYNNDGFADALIGSPNASTANGFESGELFVLFGGKNIVNPFGGVTINQLREQNKGVLLIGANERDRAGETVASAGDVNRDGIPDILIAAPKATVPDIKFKTPGSDTPRSLRVAMQYHYGPDNNRDGIPDQVADGIGIDRNGDGKADALNDNNILDTNGDVVYDADDDLTEAGVVYVVFGGTHLKGTISLSEIGTKNLPGMVLVGHAAGYELGGGSTQNGLLSHGLSKGGDFDGDGFADVMISSVLADPDGKTNAGEVYVVYGFAP